MSAPNILSLPLEEMDNTNRHIGTGIYPLDSISERPGHNPRADYGEHDGSFASLVDSIKQFGVLQPPVIVPTNTTQDAWWVVAGHRRIAAARAAGLVEVRCLELGWDWTTDDSGNELARGTLASYTEAEQSIYALIENLQRKELNCIEVAEGIARLEKLGKTQSDIARWIGRDQGRVSKTVRLLELPVGVRSLLREGVLTASHGEELLPLLSECFLPGEIERLAHDAVKMGLTKSDLRNAVQIKIKRSQPVQTTIEDIEEASGDYAPAHNHDDERIARTLASTKGLDKEPAPAPREDNGLTRKDADAEFAAAMAPDPDVVPLSERPAKQGGLGDGYTCSSAIAYQAWLQESGFDESAAVVLLNRIVGPKGLSDAKKPGMWFRLEPETAQKLMELCDWHQQENGEGLLIDQKLNDVVNSFHAAKLEMRAEAEAAKAALAATLPVFEVPEMQEPRKYDPAVEVAWRVMRTGILDRFCVLERVELSEIETLAQINTNAHDYPKPDAYLLEQYELQESGLRGDAPQWGKICRFKVMISGVEHRIDYVPGAYFDSVDFHGPADTGISESGYRSCSARHTEYTKHASPLEWAVATGEAFYQKRFKSQKGRKKKDEEEPGSAPAPAPTTDRIQYRLAYAYWEDGCWNQGGYMEEDDMAEPRTSLDSITTLPLIRALAKDESVRQPMLLIHVNVVEDKGGYHSERGDVWYFQGKPVGPIRCGLPTESELREVGAWDIKTPEEIERGVKQLKDDAAASLFAPAQGISGLTDDMVGRLI